MTSTLALDLGAESGRAVLGVFDGHKLDLRSLHRFPNLPQRIRGTLYWDVLSLFGGITESLQRAAQETGGRLTSLAVDTWGVDYALLDASGRLVANPVHYRDLRTDGIMERVFARVPREELYERTGIQFMPINSLIQLYAMRLEGDPQLNSAETLLMIPDLFHYWLSSVMVCEVTEASTSQCLDIQTNGWAEDLLERLAIPVRLFGELVDPGTALGPLLPELAERTGLKSTRVIAPASHDTASAVAAVPFSHPHAAYISSGTWSLVGVELEAPLVNDQVREANLTNERGVAGTFRLLRNVAGLWLLQDLRRGWGGAEAPPYDALVEMAEQAPPFKALIDPDDPLFLRPGDMPGRIRRFCEESGQLLPDTMGELVRCVLESLAFKYRWVIDLLERVTGRRIPVLHVVGGGSQNWLLCQLTADAANRPVLAGPAEAAAMGNLLVQAITLGELGSVQEAREVARTSSGLVSYEPRRPEAVLTAYERFCRLLSPP